MIKPNDGIKELSFFWMGSALGCIATIVLLKTSFLVFAISMTILVSFCYFMLQKFWSYMLYLEERR